ncbi:MAG: tetratricopeptide repeat protein, partial [Flammeovirgaceae bacterium]|nr:tetratricopeptide repeat protein [Flammeovirgaceae bacterium]MDW8287851.1 tetratricopeptide repeat protein [Flammeovirgaceae bacterium]
AYALLKENQQKYPDFLPTYKTLGFIMAGAGAIPTQYEWILTILGIEKDVEKGMEYLFRISRQKENIWSIETYLLLCYLQAYLLNQSEKAYHTLEQIIVEQPSLSSVRLACAWIGIRAGKSKESYRLLQNFPKMEFYFIPYLEGICLLQTGNYQEAIKAFEAFLHRNPTTDYIKDSYYKMFLASWFLGKENQAVFFLNAVRNKGSTHNTQDQYAFQFAHYARLPNKKITEARILTDGGELEKALKILEELNPDELLSTEDKVEYLYRKARIRHKMHDYSEAIRLYKDCITASHSIARYFAPSACLMLGFMYKDIFSDNEKALFYFQKTLTYSNHEYKKSLDNQAKMAILMLKKHN